MAATSSKMLPLGTPAPGFFLQDTVSDLDVGLHEVRGRKATVVMFICNHCPYVIHVQAELVRLANEYKDKGVGFVAISANDAFTYPDDGPDKMKEVAQQVGFPFPYLFDESQDVARAFKAACTPDFFVFDANLRLAYRGQLDDSRPDNDKPVNGQHLRQALDELLAGQKVTVEQKPSLGCGIKWVA